MTRGLLTTCRTLTLKHTRKHVHTQMLPNMDRKSQTNALNRDTHTQEKMLKHAFRSGQTAHESACLVKVRCLLFQQCALCVLPAVSPPGAVTQSPDTHSAWMTASPSHDAAGATRLVPPGLCTCTVHRVRGCHRGGTDGVCVRALVNEKRHNRTVSNE